MSVILDPNLQERLVLGTVGKARVLGTTMAAAGMEARAGVTMGAAKDGATTPATGAANVVAKPISMAAAIMAAKDGSTIEAKMEVTGQVTTTEALTEVMVTGSMVGTQRTSTLTSGGPVPIPTYQTPCLGQLPPPLLLFTPREGGVYGTVQTQRTTRNPALSLFLTVARETKNYASKIRAPGARMPG